MKKKNNQRKRFELLNVKLNEKHINPQTGRIEIDVLFDAVNDQNKIILAHNKETIPNDSVTSGYLGENKPRILSVLPTDSNDHSFVIIKKMKRYDRIVAMDTSSSFFHHEKISLGIAFHVTGKIKQNEIEWELIPINHLFILTGNGEKIENKN